MADPILTASAFAFLLALFGLIALMPDFDGEWTS